MTSGGNDIRKRPANLLRVSERGIRGEAGGHLKIKNA